MTLDLSCDRGISVFSRDGTRPRGVYRVIVKGLQERALESPSSQGEHTPRAREHSKRYFFFPAYTPLAHSAPLVPPIGRQRMRTHWPPQQLEREASVRICMPGRTHF